MMQKTTGPVFQPEVPPDLQHAPLVREEAFDWLDAHHPGVDSFTTGQVLDMAGEHGRRWLIGRLRARGIGNEELFSMPSTADALTVLFLRSRGVKFRQAVEAVVGEKDATGSIEPRYGGAWNRLIDIALKRLRNRIRARLLGGAVFGLLPNAGDHPNCLIIVKRRGLSGLTDQAEGPNGISHDYVYRTILERPGPSCWVLSPFREVLFLDRDQPPTRSEVTLRHFRQIHVQTERENYELLLGTMSQPSISHDEDTLRFVGRILDIVSIDFEEFMRTQSSVRSEAAHIPGLSSSDDLQLWLLTQLLDTVYPGSLCEIIESSTSARTPRLLASSAAKPWEPSPWAPPKSLDMFSGYTSRTGVPLVVERVEHPWTTVIESVESEMRYLRGDAVGEGSFSAVALPLISTAGNSVGSLYMLMPRLSKPSIEVEVRVLTLFSRVIGEIIERQRGAMHTANVSADIATFNVLKPEQFSASLLKLLSDKAEEIQENKLHLRDERLPFLLLSAHVPDADDLDAVIADRLRGWLAETLRHVEWRSFIRSHWAGYADDLGDGGFIGEIPGIGVMIALSKLVPKDGLDRIRDAFPTSINRISPANSAVKLVAWVLDVPAQRIRDAADDNDLETLATDIETWAFNVANVVDDVDQSYFLAHDQGDWDAALKRVRRALQKEGADKNSYLRRLAADCSFSLGDWPSALKYAREAVVLSRRELDGGIVRPLCQEADAHLCMGDAIRAWDLYSEAESTAPTHPLPRYYRGQGLLLLAKLLRVYEDEQRRAKLLEDDEDERIQAMLNALVDGAMDDLTSAADLLETWGLIPESYQYRNFHLVPTLIGQGDGYLLTRSPGPAASRFQSARRSFPKDDLFFREYLFAKCWEQGLHTRYGELLLKNEWEPLSARLEAAFGGTSP